jgi:hypothetical protein
MAEPIPNYPPQKWDFFAGLLTLLIPGLGQVVRGRIGKGILFFVCLYGMFFYGMANGNWKNVWIPDPGEIADFQVGPFKPDGVFKSLVSRKEYCGQFFIGVAAWPAIVQYVNFEKDKEVGPLFNTFQRCPTEEQLNEMQRLSDKRC